jgi:hypothetical protein
MLLLAESAEHPGGEKVAACTVQTGEKLLQGTIIATGEPVTERIDFDEERIEVTADVTDKTICQQQRAGFTPVEEVVCLTKLLHNTLLPLEEGKWMFSGIDLNRPFSDNPETPFEVTLVQNLAGRLTVSEIRQAGQLTGKIKFIVFKQ